MHEPELRQGPSRAARWPMPFGIETECHRQFRSMSSVYQRTGGLATGDAVAQRLAIFSDQPISVMARWIVDRIVVSFRWQSQTLVPLFQFDTAPMSLHAEVADIVRELIPAFDDWETALWFSEPNGWLGGGVPAEMVLRHRGAVLEAARADRFVALG